MNFETQFLCFYTKYGCIVHVAKYFFIHNPGISQKNIIFFNFYRGRVNTVELERVCRAPLQRSGMCFVCWWSERQGGRARLDWFWGRLCVAHSGAGTASRPGVKLLSLVQLVINKSNGQFDFIPCVCLCGTWHRQTPFLPSKMVSVFFDILGTGKRVEFLVKENNPPGPWHRFKTLVKCDFRNVSGVLL